jgi:tetratricopeptide (TPR) repeat protein
LPKKPQLIFAQEILSWAKGYADVYPRNLALATFTVSFICFHSEKYEEAIRYNYQAQGLFNSLNDEDGIAICHLILGSTYRTLGDANLALKNFLDASRQLEKSGAYPLFLMISQYGMAGINAENGNYEEAFKLYERTAWYGSTIFSGMEAFAISGMGEVRVKQRKFDEALPYLLKALKKAEDIKLKVVEAKILSELGTYYYETGDYMQAILNHEAALNIREEANMPGGTITNMLQLADIYHKQAKTGDALNLLEKALALAEKIKVKPKIFQVHKLLADLYESTGDLAKSLYHNKAYHTISREVNIEDTKKRLENMELIFEAEQTKKENATIRAQKAEIEYKNIELQKTIDELTLTKISRKAKMLTLTIAVTLFIVEDCILHFVVNPYTHHSFLISLGANGVVVFCIKPIEKVVEHYLLHRFVKLDKEYRVAELEI